MANLKITQLPAATSPVAVTDVLPIVQDGATKQASISQLGFFPAGTGAVTTTIQNKLREIISVKDFGAVGNGVTNDTLAIQKAIDALPTEGGVIWFPVGNYSASAGPWSVGNKVVTFDARNATPPVGLPGAILQSGNFDVQYGSLGSPKPGNYWMYVDYGNTLTSSTSNQISAAFNVIGTYNNQADHAGQSFFHAYSYSLTTEETTSNMGEVRGVKGTVKGNGGTTTLRSIHVTAEGYNGHTGVIRGGLLTADRTDIVDGVWTSGSQSVAVGGQIGAGGLSCFIAEAARAQQRPSYAYLVTRTGSAAILPEVACYEGHGGGNGSIFRGIRSDVDSDVIYDVDRFGRQMARSYYSGRTTIADDSTATITISSGSGSSGIIMLWGLDLSQVWVQTVFRVTASPFMQEMAIGTLAAVTTGDLTGTTGADGFMTVSAKNDGTIEIENRTGASRTFAWVLFHPSSALGNLS